MATQVIDPTDAAIAQVESGGDYSAANPNSSARGKYQFMPETFAGVQRNNPDLPKMSFEQFQKDPAAQEQYQVALRKENERTLKRNGLDITPSNAYFTHFFGAPKGVAMLKAEDDVGITKFLSKDVIKANRLDPNMTVGQLRTAVGSQMDQAMGKTSTAYKVDVNGVGNTEVPVEQPADYVQQGIKPSTTPFANVGMQEKKQLDALDQSLAKVRQYPQGSPEFNMAVADGFKKDMGPNWQNAFLSALFGQKEQALTWITGGKIDKPQIAEAYVNGQLKQIFINTNARGDKWYTDPSNNKRLPDNIQITSQSPEGAIGTALTSNAIKAGQAPDTGIGARSAESTKLIQEAENKVSSMSNALPANYGLLENIQANTKKFTPALSNITKSAAGSALLSTVQAFFKGSVDRSALEAAAIKYGIEEKDLGDFVQYMRDINTISQKDSAMKENHAPGSGTAGDLSLEGGAQGVQKWLNRRIHDQAMQEAYNKYFFDNKTTARNIVDLNNNFVKSAEFNAVKNFEKRRAEGKNANIEDGAPIADFDRNGQLIIRKYNARTKRGE
jgi:hypothetical protein